jgi:uncharacterized membrane protein
MTVDPGMRRDAREARAYDRGAWTAVVICLATGVVGFVAWVFYLVQLGQEGSDQYSTTVAAVTLVLALVCTVFCAVFAGVGLVLTTLHRARTEE